VSEDALRQLEITITSSSWTAPLPTKTIGCSTGSRRPYGKLRRCRRRRSGLTILFAFECGESELWVIAKFRNKTKDLIQKIKEVMGSLNRDTMAKACISFRSRN
jgi:hypothetical protein